MKSCISILKDGVAEHKRVLFSSDGTGSRQNGYFNFGYAGVS